jgi:anti-anti-sigma regulatory factor
VEDDVVSGVEVREWRKGGVLVKLRGEFDRHNLEDLRETLGGVVELKRPTLIDLAGVTFLDVGVTRELTVRSRLYAHHLTLSNPSWQARASAVACELGEF